MLRAAVRREKRDKVNPSLSGVDGPDNALSPRVQAHAATFAGRVVAGGLNRPMLAEIARILPSPRWPTGRGWLGSSRRSTTGGATRGCRGGRDGPAGSLCVVLQR